LGPRAVILSVAAALLAGCLGTPVAEDDTGRKPVPAGGPHGGGQPSVGDPNAFSDVMVSFGDTGNDLLNELSFLLGADRRPGYALRTIRDVHDLSDWSYKIDAKNGVERCRESLEDLKVSDYEGWDETGMVVVVISTMIQRDASALVRNDCVGVLTWFYDWIHPLAEEIPAGSEPGEDAVLDALRALDSILTKEGGAAAGADRSVLVDAIATLGNFPWAKVALPEPRLMRTRVAQPRGVVRALASRPLKDARGNALLADTLDRALIRVTDQVITMSLLGALIDPADHVRSAAARAIQDRRLPGGVAQIARALPVEKESPVRLSCIAALGALGGDDEAAKAEAIPALAAALGDVNDSVRRAAATELARLTGEDPGPDVADWQRWWREKSPEAGTEGE
jgi:hypothetical protein